MNTKTIILFAGLVMSLIGILMDNWKIATVGNSLALFSTILL